MQAIKLKIASPIEKKPLTLKIKSSPNSKNNSSEEYRVTAENYSRFKDQRVHIYKIPDTYVGSCKQMKRVERVLNLETSCFQEKEITLPQAVENIFVEISSNSGDNVARSKKQNVDSGEVSVTMTKSTITVRNGGIPIPVEIHPEENMYAAELIFGNLLSSSNYNEDKARTECGRNGYGAKLTNIFSKQFSVTIADHHNKKWYRQIWKDNMKVRQEPEIRPLKANEKPFVEIVYTMDFERFGYKEYPEEAFELFARHCADMAFALKVPISFNGKKFVVKDAKDYAKLYLGKENVRSSILYLEWPKGTDTYTKKNVEYAKDKGILPKMEICAVDTPDNALKVAFVNGKWTRNGGVHYEAAFKAVTDGVLKTINERNGGKGKKKKGEKVIKLTLADIKKHVSLFVSCWIEDPIFDAQTKTELMDPTPKVSIGENILKNIMKWELISRLYAELDAKQFRAASKSDGKKRKNLSGMDKLEDANKAATSESTNCTLYITEGDSAQTFASKLCSYIPSGKGRDYIGTYPLKGKPLNVMNAIPQKIAENKEINELKKILGLREGVDYMIEENYQTLRYGHLMVLADADPDGIHILGLIFDLFHVKYPSLLARGFVKYLRTKILEVRKGKQKIKFYSQHEYDLWKEKNPDYQKWEHSYYKGLGSSEDEDIEEESKDPKIVMTVYDDLAPYSLRLAFDKNLANNRKAWIAQWEPDYTVEQMKVQPISAFINHQFIQFSIADVARSIPRFTDGLKTSQRKILWSAIKRWGQKAGSDATKMKVAQFAAYVSEKMAYMHGENSLVGAIVGMAQDFVGSNNLPYLTRNGEFGTRAKVGKDASAGRYIFTKPEWSVPLLFRKEDIPILNIVIDEGQEIEPVTLLPIIPMQLVNGCLGIGSGTSTYISAHNPLDLVYWIEAKIKGITTPNLIPWYRNFEGDINLKTKGKKKEEETDDEEEEDEEDPDEVLIDKRTKVSMETCGKYEEQGNTRKKITVTEIPIGRSIHSYKNYLDKLRENKKISKYDNYSTPHKPHFEIYGMKRPSLKQLKLIKSYGMSNMVLLDNHNRPVKYENAEAIMETFYHIRLGYYGKRRDYMIWEKAEKIKLLNAKIQFILAVLKGYELIKENSKISDEEANNLGGILVLGRSKKDIGFQIEKCGLDAELLKKVSLYNLTSDEIENSRKEIQKKEEEKKTIEAIKPETMWLNDLEEFTKAYCKHYKTTYTAPKKIVLNILT